MIKLYEAAVWNKLTNVGPMISGKFGFSNCRCNKYNGSTKWRIVDH